MTERVVALIDMDCFYCQVETRLNPALKGLPLAVVQYNEWKGGGIIAVNYEARERGVTRYMRGNEAKEQCPEIILARVPMLREKADLSRYREAGREVVAVLCTFSDCVERASVDEAYLDLTAVVNKKIAETSSPVSAGYLNNTYIVGYTAEGSTIEEERLSGLNSWLNDIYDTSFHDLAGQKLAVGALIVEEIRRAVFETTGFRCSAGIAHNKILAKLACGLHKPNRQTVIPQSSVPVLFKNLPAKKVRLLGGKLGDSLMERLGIKVMADLLKFSENELQKIYDLKTGTWLYNIARGYDNDPVNPRLISKSIGCRKNFPGRTALTNTADIHHWVSKLAEELLERLNEDNVMNKRRAQILTVSMGLEINNRDTASSKSSPLSSYKLEKIIAEAYNILKKTCVEDPVTKIWSPPIKHLGLSAGKFVSETSNKIINFFRTNEKFDESTKSSLKTEHFSLGLTARKFINEDSNEINSVLTSNENCNESNKLPSKTEQSSPVERENLCNAPRVNSKVNNTLKSENKQLSFFEKMLLQGHSTTETKLNILPDLNKPDSQNEKETSCNPGASKKIDVKFDSIQNEVKLPLEKQVNSVTNDNLNGKTCANKTNKISISSFFSCKTLKDNWIDPEEIFPDLSIIDDNVIKMFPISFRKKIIELRKVSLNSKTVENSSNKSLGPSCSNIQTETEKCLENEDIKEKKSHVIADNDEASDKDIFENSDPSIYFKCNECGENILIKDREIHLDLHVAIKLDNELNYQGDFPRVSNQLKVLNSKNFRNKRKTKNSDVNSKVTKKPKGIEAFFKK